MHPFLIGDLPTYGPLLLLGILLGIFLYRRGARRMPMDVEASTDVIILIVILGFAGARLLHVLVMADVYLASWTAVPRIFKLWDGGFAYVGGVITGALSLIVLRHRIPMALTADLMVVPLAFTHLVGRLGCFSAGCCHGKAHAPYMVGVHFRPDSAAAPFCNASGSGECLNHVFLHPTQLYESLGILFIIVILVVARPLKRVHGQLTAWYLFAYGILRFGVEIFRGDPTRGFPLRISTPALNRFLGFDPGVPVFFSTSQIVSLGLMGSAVAILWHAHRIHTSPKSQR